MKCGRCGQEKQKVRLKDGQLLNAVYCGDCHCITTEKSMILKRSNNTSLIEVCDECGFPTGWERKLVLMKNNYSSYRKYVENKCSECGHQRDGYTIKKIQPLLRKYGKKGRKEGVENVIEMLEDLRIETIHTLNDIVMKRINGDSDFVDMKKEVVFSARKNLLNTLIDDLEGW